MTIIDRYILRQFILNFIILMVVVQALFVSVDLVVNLESYLRAAKVMAEREHLWHGWAFARVFFDYYGPMCLLMYVYLTGIVVAAAMGFTVVSLQRARELTAVVASGVSLRRVAMTFFAASLALNMLAIPVQQWLLPPLAFKALRSRSDLVNKGAVAREPVLYMGVNARGDLLSAQSFDLEANTLTGFHLLERDEAGNPLRRIDAPSAKWNEARQAWVFEPQARVMESGKTELDAHGQATMDSWPSNFSPKAIHSCNDSKFARLLSLGDMAELAETPTLNRELRDSLRQAWWGRFAMPLFGALMALVGLPGILSRVPAISSKQAMNTTGLCLGCWVVGLFFMSVTFLPPVLSAWLPVAGLGGLAFYRVRFMET